MKIFSFLNANKIQWSKKLSFLKNIFNNRFYIIILILTLVIQICCVEFGGKLFRTVPLNIREHLFCLGMGSLPIFLSTIFECFVPVIIFKNKNKK
jgi:hypothetical protein